MNPRIISLVEDFERGRISRRALIVQLGALFAAAGAVRGGGAAQPTFKATAIDHVALNVTDVARSRDFYAKHLGLKPLGEGDRDSCFLDCGPDFLALFRAEKPGMDHYCYAIEDYEPADAVKRLEAAGLGPRRRGNRVYFDDPDGLEVQVARGG